MFNLGFNELAVKNAKRNVQHTPQAGSWSTLAQCFDLSKRAEVDSEQ